MSGLGRIMNVRHRKWGAGPGYQPVDSTTLCVLIRIRMRHWWHLALAYRRFRRIAIRCERSGNTGLIRFAFAIESPWTFHTISLWESEAAIPMFGSIHELADAVRWTFRRSAEIWSSEWTLSAVSRRSQWGGQSPDLGLGHESTDPMSRRIDGV